LLRIRCLGQLSVSRDGQPLAGAATQPRRLAILALLARAGDRGVTREKLIACLWPDSDEERARRLLSQAVYMLRRDLGADDAIAGVRDLRLGQDVVTSDLAEFQEALDARAYERAAALYAGPFLDGFYLPGAGDFQRWVDDERRALEHDADATFEKCAVAAESRGDHATAVLWWRKIAARDPLNARTAIRLMRALAASGDRHLAIRHAAIHQTLVDQHLDLPADTDVLRLADELRAGARATAEPATPLPAKADLDTPAPPSGAEEPRHGTLAFAPPPADDDRGPAPAAALAPSAPPLPSAGSRRFRPWATFAAVAGALLVAVVVWIARPPAQPQEPVVVPSRVVVAPLENRTGDPSLDVIGAMVAEWVTQGLLRTGLVQVVDARTMLETARDAGPTRGEHYLRTLAERTGAGTIVAGSYFVEGDQLRFLMRVTGAPSGELRHTVDVVNAPVDRPTAALEPLRQRITGALAVLLDPRLNNWTARTSQPPTYEAYTEFLLGMRTFGADYESSVRHFARAAQLDSGYPQAKLWAAMSYANLRRYPPADSLFRVLDLNRASLAPYDEANLDYFYSGFVRGDWEASYRGGQRMLELAPGAGHAIYAAGLAAQITNRPDEAADVLQRIAGAAFPASTEGWEDYAPGDFLWQSGS
jgi:DNA-binding SARP family transcriptional activator/TolB-like protein